MEALLRLPRAARAAAHRAVQATGIDRLVAKTAWRRRRLLVLCYHGVSIADEHRWADLYVSPEHLEQRLRLVRKAGGTILPFSEAVERLYADDLPECAVALTFDDGAYDFYAKASPILSAESAHATLYLTTWYCGKPYPVFDTMASYLMWKGGGRTVRIPGLEHTALIPTHRNDPAFAQLHARLLEYADAASLSGEEKQALLVRLAAAIGVDFDRLMELRLLQIMRPDEVAALDRSLVDVELHTHRHRTPRTQGGLATEIVDNQVRIADYSGDPRARRHFCYPSGDHIPEYGAWLKALGVETATTCDPGLMSTRSDPYFIPRIFDTEGLSDEMFTAWVTGVGAMTSPGQFLPRARGRVRN